MCCNARFADETSLALVAAVPAPVAAGAAPVAAGAAPVAAAAGPNWLAPVAAEEAAGDANFENMLKFEG